MKKTLIIFSILFLMSFIATAQDSLYIFKTGSIVTRRAVADIDSILFKSFGALKAPEGLSATPANGQIALSWNTVSTATSYNIYRSTVSGVTKTNGTKISNVVGFPYTNTGTLNGTKYYYVVTAVNSSGESGESAEVNATSFVPADTGWGGTATLNVINGVTYAVHTFTYNAVFYPPVNLTHARVLLVGSGGTGGGDPLVTTAIGGGGGGGEVRDIDVVISGTSMPVTISTDAGSVTSFGNQSVTNGSSGVGGTGGGGGTSGNGIAGGIGLYHAGGGGGGATGHGTDGIADNYNPMGGNGGAGMMSNISGTAMYFGGGGGGGAETGYSGKSGTGGVGGGGSESKGAANTGGGGGGASHSGGGGYTSFTPGYLGGSGVVIISYQL